MAFAWMFTSAIAMAVVSDPKVAIVAVITIMIHKIRWASSSTIASSLPSSTIGR